MMRRLCPRRLGSLVQANARRLSLLLSLSLLILCAAINSGKIDVELSRWIQRTTRVEQELQSIEAAIGDGAGSNNLLIFQTPKKLTKETSTDIKVSHIQPRDVDDDATNNNDILSVKSMMIHLEALAIATHVTIDLFDVSWSLKDICFAPTPPDYEGLLVNQMLDHLMPCVIKTPLDCFWEGAKLLGPEQEVRLSSIGPKLKWTNLDPLFMIEAQKNAHPHASFPYQTLLNWMQRVGINDGYLRRPCLDPSDPNCPTTAPNKLSGETPNIGHTLTGGCRGLATKQMHWKEEELVGGAVKNRSGYIFEAEALQSTVMLMGERDVYDYWRKTSKVQDINNWSTDKAKLVLSNWQDKFKEELAQFSRSSVTTNPFKVHALTPKAMLEPIDNNRVLDITNFRVAAIFMTIFTCIVFPTFNRTHEKTNEQSESKNGLAPDDGGQHELIGRSRVLLLAITISTIVIVTFVASLGLSSFINLPINMATTQILPPLALFYGFRQAIMIANTYSDHYRKQTYAKGELTIECLSMLLPIIVIECTTFVIPLIVATAFPVQATRVFTLQAIAYILLSTTMALLLIPSVLTIFLDESEHDKEKRGESLELRYRSGSKSQPCSHASGASSAEKTGKNEKTSGISIEEHIFSRLKDDLKNIKSDPHKATDINFSACLGPEGFRTSFTLSTSGTSQPYSHQLTYPSTFASQKKSCEPTLQLPDLLLRPDALIKDDKFDKVDDAVDKKVEICSDDKDDSNEDDSVNSLALYERFYILVVSKRYLQISIVLMKIFIVVVILMQGPKVRFGLQLRDIILKGTEEYETLTLKEKYFPVYNVFAITKSGIDFPSNQRLMHEFYERMRNVEGVINDRDDTDHKFWLIYFRDWLLELQVEFDKERNRSAISKEGWNDDTSDAAKLAYKLLAQTGRVDNPIDKNLVDTNRLVDKDGIINQRAFYYYLTAWVMNDAFTYSNSEADFKPEPKSWNENPNDLRIERARPLTYSQIPFLMKLPEDQDNMRSILEIRAISQRFEQFDLPNFPTGIPFIFWDQFINLDYLFYTAAIMIIAMLCMLIGFTFTNFTIAAMLIMPTALTLFEIYSLQSFLDIQFNSIVGVMLLAMIGVMTVHIISIMAYYECTGGELSRRVCVSIGNSFKTVIISLFLLAATAFVSYTSKMDFMTKYSYAFVYITISNAFNALLLTPTLLALLGSDRITHDDNEYISPSRSPMRSPPRVIRRIVKESNKSKQTRKKRGYPSVQSEISLSTISEESQIEPLGHDLKLNLSIRC